MGTNPEAAKFTGIREVRIRMGISMLAGVLAAISAVINNSWLMTARADAGTGMEMQAITVLYWAVSAWPAAADIWAVF
ncbi:MAG: ABC transporter permease subunit [Enterocloster bolteae]